MPLRQPSDCTCPTPEQVNDMMIRGETFGTKEPCPIHETPEKLADLCALQARILDEALDFARPGGLLAYMTCSLLRVENEEQPAAFLVRHPRAELLDQRRFSPLTGGDGFFLAVMRVS